MRTRDTVVNENNKNRVHGVCSSIGRALDCGSSGSRIVPGQVPPPYCNMRWTVEPCKQYNPVLDVGFRVRSSERLKENSPTGCIPCFLLILVGKWEKPIDLGSVVCGFDSHLGYINIEKIIAVLV